MSLGNSIWGKATLSRGTQYAKFSFVPVKEDIKPQSKEEEVSEDQCPGKGLLGSGVYGKTTAVKFVAALFEVHPKPLSITAIGSPLAVQ